MDEPAKSAAKTLEGLPAQKPPRADTEERIEQTIEIVGQHFRDVDAVREVARRFDLSERQARDYVARAWERIHEQRKAVRHLDAEQMIHQFETLAQEARALAEDQPGAMSAAVQAMDRVAKIKGVFAATKIEHGGTVGHHEAEGPLDLSKLTDDELAELERLQAKAARSA